MNYSEQKIKDLRELAVIVRRLKEKGKKIALCHGVFDLLHPGHLKHFASARKSADILIVTVTRDKYVRKGPGRPILSEVLRTEMLAALAIVDYISIIDSPSAVECIRAIEPDFYVKGPDYKDKEKDATGKIYTEEEAVESLGGKLVFTDDTTYSSTELIAKYISENNKVVKEGAGQYVNELMATLQGIEVTDALGRDMTFNEGFKLAIGTILSQASLDKKLMFIGNGGSASIANHQAADFSKNAGFQAISFSDPTVLTAISNDFGYKHVFEKLAEIFAREGDVFIAISSSGESENILNGVNKAKESGCKVISFSGFKKSNSLRRLGEINFYVPADKYGLVETSHTAINHFIVDAVIEEKGLARVLANICKP